MMPLMLRQYRVRSVIASGCMGTVYRAYATLVDRMVAVKLIRGRARLRRPQKPWRIFFATRACAFPHTKPTAFPFIRSMRGRTEFPITSCWNWLTVAAWILAIESRDACRTRCAGYRLQFVRRSMPALKHNVLHRDLPAISFRHLSHKLIDFGLALLPFDVEPNRSRYALHSAPITVSPEKISAKKAFLSAHFHTASAAL